MFFYNLSRPLELSPEGITIGFGKEIFVKQAQDNSKNAPLKKAAMSYFGVEDINVHIKLADENDVIPVTKPLSNIPSVQQLNKMSILYMTVLMRRPSNFINFWKLQSCS